MDVKRNSEERLLIISKYISIHNYNTLNILDVYTEAWFLHLNGELKKKISVKSEKKLENHNFGNKLSLIYLGWTCKYNVTACKTHIYIYSVICIPFTKHV